MDRLADAWMQTVQQCRTIWPGGGQRFACLTKGRPVDDLADCGRSPAFGRFRGLRETQKDGHEPGLRSGRVRLPVDILLKIRLNPLVSGLSGDAWPSIFRPVKKNDRFTKKCS